jgi:hypothetical protein
MNLHRTGQRTRWVFATLIVVLLGAQVLQSAHLHADHGLAPDCAQCQVDGGQAMAVTDAETPPCLPSGNALNPDIATAPVATFYRLAARGPPELSS